MAPTSPAFNIDQSAPSGPAAPQHLIVDDAINFSHMELLVHITQDKDIFNLGAGDAHGSGIALGLKVALQEPYLMHELLAFSAQHLAHLHPEKSAYYLHQAMSLQTRAISLFNAAWNGVNESNCVAVLLFASCLGHQLLAETLRRREDSLDAFLTHYLQCIGMHRGVYAIAKGAWPLLMESELEPVLSVSQGFTSQTPMGSNCDVLRDLMDNNEALTEIEKEGCHMALHYLQVGFDAALGNVEMVNRHQMIHSWPMLVSLEFTSLLQRKQPEVLVILAYYAVLLHYGRSLWQSGDASVYLLNLVTDYLGAGWQKWLEFPRQEISRLSP